MISPRLLLLEDDPVAARCLHDVLAALPADVVVVSTLAAAAARAGDGHDLWLFDAHLPDGHASTLLPRLRARGLATPALALSADVGDDDARALRTVGFAAVLAKPIDAATLRAEVRRHLGAAAPQASRPQAACAHPRAAPAWDDAAALAALADMDAVRALRALFLAELPEQCRRVRAACADGDAAAARALLHRLKSGCAYVGAAALLDAVRAVAADPADGAALARFDACADALAH